MSYKIKMIVVDIDGTMTDGVSIFDNRGNVSKRYHTRDCRALWKLKYIYGIHVLVLTNSNHACDRHRFDDLLAIPGKYGTLHDHLIQTRDAKEDIMEDVLKTLGISWDNVAYIGDADNDMACLQKSGWSSCPSDAEDRVKDIVDYVAERPGGAGAVAEFAELIITQIK